MYMCTLWLQVVQILFTVEVGDSSYHAVVETNNGVETQNKALKYKFLPCKSASPSCIATIIIECFLLEQHRNYLFLNFQIDPSYRAYNTHTPPYLRGQPRNIILHCWDVKKRQAKSPVIQMYS